MDYLTIDSERESLSAASSTNQLHIEELSKEQHSGRESSTERTFHYDSNDDERMDFSFGAKAPANSPLKGAKKRTPSPQRLSSSAASSSKAPSSNLKRSGRVLATPEKERPLLRQPLVTNRYRSSFLSSSD